MAFAAAAPYAIPALMGLLGFGASKMGQSQKTKSTQYPTMSPEQQQFQDQILKLLGGELGGEEDFESFAAPYKRQFNEETIPGISERFAGLGGLSSSGFTQSLGQAGAGLSEKLASLQQMLKRQKFQSLLPFAFQSRFHTDIEKPQQGNWLSDLLGPILQGYGGQLGSNLGSFGFGG